MIDDVKAYYDQTHFQYKIVWKLDRHHGIHYGYWDEHTRTHEQAIMRLNEVAAESASLDRGSKVLDMGCGVGGHSVFLAEKYGHQVTGINIQLLQLKLARELAAARKQEDKVSFLEADFCDTGLPDQSFDAVFALECLCHAENKSRLVKEAFRLLKPGGKLVIVAYFIKDHKFHEAKPMKNWLRSWAIPYLETFPDFKAILIREGFADFEVRDGTNNIVPSSRKLYFASFPGAIRTELLHLLKPMGPYARNHYKSAYWQYVALKKGYWDYLLIRATKSI